MSASIPTGGIHGLMAEFESATQLVAAANKTREAGFVDVDAYSPIPIEELHHAIGFKSTKLPMPYHPVFNNPRFALASRNRFFLCIEATDGQFDLDRTRAFMQTLGAYEV